MDNTKFHTGVIETEATTRVRKDRHCNGHRRFCVEQRGATADLEGGGDEMVQGESMVAREVEVAGHPAKQLHQPRDAHAHLRFLRMMASPMP